MIGKLYYLLTAYIPRKIPRNEEEFNHMKEVFVRFYGLEDNAQTWTTVAGHLTSVPATKIRVSWGNVANAGKRLTINNKMHMIRLGFMNELKSKFEAAIAAENERVQKEQAVSEQSSEEIQQKADAQPQPPAPEVPKPEEVVPQQAP